MSDKCSYRGALETQERENHQRVAQRRITEYVNESVEEKPKKGRKKK